MMKVFLIVVLAIIGLLFVKIVVARRKLRKRWKQEEEYALQISRKVYELLLYPLYRLSNDIPTFAEIKVQRIVGSLMVLVGIVLFLCFK